MFQRRFVLASILAVLAASPLLAAAAQKTPQQELMSKCSAQNKGKTGDAYRSAQKSCLSGGSAGGKSSANASQQRMKDCNAQAAGKKGEERKSFLGTCLKSH